MLLLLILSVVVAAVRLPFAAQTAELRRLFTIQSGLFIGFALLVAAMVRWEQAAWVRFARPAATVSIVFTCYTTLGQLGVAAMPFLADSWLLTSDNWLLGFNPTFALEPYLTQERVEVFAVCYGAFIPYIYLTIALNCVGQPPQLREQFLTGWVLLYSVSYLGYLFLPAHGPLVYHEHEYTVAISGGMFMKFVNDGIVASGGMQGVFPSLHIGGSLYLCLFELRVNRLRGLIYLPLVLTIYMATIVLRFHYVVDLIAGTILASACLPLGRAVFNQWTSRRAIAGIPALPGGEGDVLPTVPTAGEGYAAPVLSAD